MVTGEAVLTISADLALPLDVVTEATAIVATRGAGKSSASAVIVEEAFAAGVQSVVLDRTGVYHGLRSNRRGNGPGLGIYVLGGPHGDVPLETHAGGLVADLVVDTGHSFVLDLSDFTKGAAIRFAADLLEQLYDRKARARATTLLVVDEAHFYAPQTPRGGFKGDAARLMGAMEDVVGLGRSRGLGVVLTTQRTQALNKAILDLIETLLVMRMLSPRARAAVRDWIREKHEEDEQGVIASLDSLPTGTAWVWAPLRGILERVKVRRIHTFDSYATPRPGETRVEPTARAELDLDQLGAQIAATAERARENDPAELRKRLVAAEKLIREQAETIDAMARVEVAERIVEVPVFPDKLRETIRRDYDALALAALAAQETMEEAIGRADANLRAALASLQDSGREQVSQRGPSAPRQTEDVVTPPPQPARETDGAVPAPRPETNGDLGTGAKHLLATLASHHPLRLTVGQLALLSGRKARGGAWNSSMKQLREGGYVLEDAGMLFVTDDGLEASGQPVRVDHGPDRWRAALPAASRDVFDYLVERWPAAIPLERIADDLGRAARGGSWNSAIATLTRNGLAVRGPDGLAATEEAVGR